MRQTRLCMQIWIDIQHTTFTSTQTQTEYNQTIFESQSTILYHEQYHDVKNVKDQTNEKLRNTQNKLTYESILIDHNKIFK